MSDLSRLQHDFLTAISAQEGGSVDSALSAGPLSAAQRIEIYRNAYFTQLIGVLSEDYPTVRGLLGDDAFKQMSRDFIILHPSSNTSVRWFGEALPDYLACTDPYSRHGVLAELAEWERLLRLMFDAGDAQPIDMTAFQSIAPEAWPTLRFDFIPALTLHRHRFNTAPIWKALKEELTPPEPQVLEQEETWLLWRSEWVTLFRSLAVDEAAAITAVSEGANFADLCELLWEWHGDAAAQRAAQLLQSWTQAGLLQGLTQET
ncbi:DNA-binding domain-containing protein [Hahella sp. CR1]|uniref:DNA-binding domain-containing protein n=1 Tax=Hahella sp. CR1 TaxID=2992807 RepID=UPI0024436A5C|nr:DNA-binding domain-containing protein [Hahella sp. CR1]MDG9666875.1 DNA-binding domain-containing protein [Hahella sp. CR1]